MGKKCAHPDQIGYMPFKAAIHCECRLDGGGLTVVLCASRSGVRRSTRSFR